MTPELEALQRRLLGDLALSLEAGGDEPLGQHALALVALALAATHLGTIARVLDHCRDGDSIQVNAWDMGQP